MSALIGALRVTLGLDSAAFEKGASAIEKRSKGLERSLTAMGSNMQAVGKKLSLAVTVPLVAFGYTAVKAAMESREAMGQVETALASMGDAAGRSKEQLADLAASQMNKSLYDDDEILRKVTANLLTFGSVAGDNFDRAQQAAIDLSARLGQDLQNSTLMVGKALNDPVKGLAALRRVGIQFTAQQEAMIRSMAEAGDVAGAQKVMLSELEHQFKGSAEAMRKADPFGALKISVGELQETIGEKLLPVIVPLIDKLGGLVEAFSNLPDGMQTFIVAAGAIAAALGPVLIGVGALINAFAPLLAVIGTVIGQLGLSGGLAATFTGLGAALGPVLPIIAAVAAAGYLIYKNWDKIAPVLKETWEQIKNTLGPPLKALMDNARAAFDEIMGSEFMQGLIELGRLVGNIGLVLLKAFGGALPGVLRAIGGLLAGVFNVAIDLIRIVVNLLSGDWAGAWQAAKDLVGHVGEALKAIFGGLGQAVIGFISGMVKGIRDWMGARLNAIWNDVKTKVKEVGGWFKWLYDKTVGHSYIPDMVEGIAANMARLDRVLVDPAKKAADLVKQVFEKLSADVDAIMRRLFPDSAMFAGFANDRAALQAGIAQGGVAGYTVPQLQAALKALGSEEFKEAFKDFQVATNDNADAAEQANVRIVKSFRQMAQDTLSVLDRLSGAIRGGGFLDILSAVIDLGLQLGSIGVFGKKVQTGINSKVPGYAGGTSFHPGGLAMVGERGPELVSLPRGSKVHPNGGGMGGNTFVFKGNLLTPEFWAQINAGHVAAADGGGQLGLARVRQANEWALR